MPIGKQPKPTSNTHPIWFCFGTRIPHLLRIPGHYDAPLPVENTLPIFVFSPYHPGMPPSLFRERLSHEFDVRRAKNGRYSLRAFAVFLGTDHSTLSQILRGRRRVPDSHIHDWSKKLKIDGEEVAYYTAAESVPDSEATRRQEYVRHWTAEVQTTFTQSVHWKILALSRTPQFRADCRWIGEQTGTTVDEVNLAFSRLLRLGLIEVKAKDRWVDLTGLSQLSESAFRKLALERIRQKANYFHEVPEPS